jgi:hypothetical protein
MQEVVFLKQPKSESTMYKYTLPNIPYTLPKYKVPFTNENAKNKAEYRKLGKNQGISELLPRNLQRQLSG